MHWECVKTKTETHITLILNCATENYNKTCCANAKINQPDGCKIKYT